MPARSRPSVRSSARQCARPDHRWQLFRAAPGARWQRL